MLSAKTAIKDNYDYVTILFNSQIIQKDLNDYAETLYNGDVKDYREINELIAFYGNMILQELSPSYTLETTRYNEKIYVKHHLHEHSSFNLYLKKQDYSYNLIVDKADYFDHDTLKDYQDSFKSHLRNYIVTVLNEITE